VLFRSTSVRKGSSGDGLDTLDPLLVLERVARPRVPGAGTVQSRLAQIFIALALVFTAVAVPLGDTFFLRLGT
jgi:hypothetical protein